MVTLPSPDRQPGNLQARPGRRLRASLTTSACALPGRRLESGFLHQPVHPFGSRDRCTDCRRRPRWLRTQDAERPVVQRSGRRSARQRRGLGQRRPGAAGHRAERGRTSTSGRTAQAVDRSSSSTRSTDARLETRVDRGSGRGAAARGADRLRAEPWRIRPTSFSTSTSSTWAPASRKQVIDDLRAFLDARADPGGARSHPPPGPESGRSRPTSVRVASTSSIALDRIAASPGMGGQSQQAKRLAVQRPEPALEGRPECSPPRAIGRRQRRVRRRRATGSCLARMPEVESYARAHRPRPDQRDARSPDGRPCVSWPRCPG